MKNYLLSQLVEIHSLVTAYCYVLTQVNCSQTLDSLLLMPIQVNPACFFKCLCSYMDINNLKFWHQVLCWQRVPRYELILKELVKRTSKVRLHEVNNFVQIFLLLVTKTQPFHNITPLLLTKCQAGMFRVLHPHYRLYIYYIISISFLSVFSL